MALEYSDTHSYVRKQIWFIGMTFGRAINPYYVLIMFGSGEEKKKSNLGLKLTVPGIIFKEGSEGFLESSRTKSGLLFFFYSTTQRENKACIPFLSWNN